MFTGIVQGTAKLVSIDEKPKLSHPCGDVTGLHAGGGVETGAVGSA